MNKYLLSLVAGLSLSTPLFAGEIYSDFPKEIDANASYVFYSHGYIVEGDNPKPINTKQGWGVYDFPKVKQALSDESYHLIAFHRPKDTDEFKYAVSLEKQVRQLVAAGVSAKNITLVGFSRGAFITGLTSDKLSDIGVNTVLLAGCGRLVSRNHSDIKVYGNVLSIYEETDRSHTCLRLKQKSKHLDSFKEIGINTGLSHGAFYRPLAVWVDPVKNWIKSIK